MAETREEEFDEVFDRIVTKVDMSEVYNVDDVINRIDRDYPLNHPKDHIIYTKMGERSHGIIQSNITDYITWEVKTEKLLTPQQKAAITRGSKEVFKPEDKAELLTKVEDYVEERVGTLLDDMKAEEKDRDAVEKKIIRETSTVQKAIKRMNLNIHGVYEPELSRSRRMLKSEEYVRALEGFTEPKRLDEVVDTLHGDYFKIDKPEEPLARGTLRGDLFILEKKEFINEIRPGEYTLTESGKRYLKRLKEKE